MLKVALKKKILEIQDKLYKDIFISPYFCRALGAMFLRRLKTNQHNFKFILLITHTIFVCFRFLNVSSCFC